MSGYYNRPDLTGQAIDSNGWLHTGDLGWLDASKHLHYCGRIKEQINRGGEKINPAEVEAAMSALPGIKLCKVIGIPDDFLGEEICACVILKNGVNLQTNESKTYLASRLAKYKIPKFIIYLNSFPTNSTGKIHRQKLIELILNELQ